MPSPCKSYNISNRITEYLISTTPALRGGGGSGFIHYCFSRTQTSACTFSHKNHSSGTNGTKPVIEEVRSPTAEELRCFQPCSITTAVHLAPTSKAVRLAHGLLTFPGRWLGPRPRCTQPRGGSLTDLATARLLRPAALPPCARLAHAHLHLLRAVKRPRCRTKPLTGTAAFL